MLVHLRHGHRGVSVQRAARVIDDARVAGEPARSTERQPQAERACRGSTGRRGGQGARTRVCVWGGENRVHGWA
eukprot:353454-Chlamydomonas_euryale.AAC.9